MAATYFKTFTLNLLKIYQLALSPLLGQHCRFYPSCSCYMNEAIQHYGIGKGVYLGLKRLLRCHPFCKGGIDLLKTTEKPLP